MHPDPGLFQELNRRRPRADARGRPPITRRQLLSVGAAGVAGALLAACGESDAEKIEVPTLAATRDASAPVPTAIATDRTERAPSRAGAIPQPGEQRRISVAVPAFGGTNWDVDPILLAAGHNAARASDNRYRYEANRLPSNFGYRWDYAAAVEGGAGGRELLAIQNWDLDSLVSAERLLPLSPFIASDDSFDPDIYWPGVLNTGNRNGVQYALPIAVAPWITFVNQDLAAASGHQIPPRNRWDRNAFLEAAIAMHGDPAVPGREHALGVLFNVEPMWGAPDQLWSWAPSFLFLQAALGPIPSAQGAFEALRSPEAHEIVQFIYDLASTHGFAPANEREAGRTWLRFRDGDIGLMVQWLGGIGFGWMTGSRGPDNVLYPFPDFAGHGNPVEVWLMLGISADAEEPRVAYDALRVLQRSMHESANVPAIRISAAELQAIAPEYRADEAQMVVDLMESASYVRLTRPQWGAFINAVDAGIIREELSALEALEAVVHQLEATGARV